MDRVNYKPLGSVDSDCCNADEDELFSRPLNPTIGSVSAHDDNYYLFNSATGKPSAHRLGLRHLRLILCLLSMLLFLLFIAQLFTHQVDRNLSQTEPPSELGSSSTTLLREQSSYSSRGRGDDQTGKMQQSGPNRNDRPPYKSYLSSVLNNRNYPGQREFAGQALDDLHYPTTSSSNDRPATIWWLLNLRNDKYVTVTNYIRAMKSFNYNASISLTSQATSEFMYHTLELCERWDGPISLAVFAPGDEMLVATTLIKFMRQCLAEPLSACIRDKVTWHLVYNKQHGPPPSAVGYPKYHLDSRNFPLFVNQDRCPKLAGPDSVDLIRQFEIELRKANKILSKSYRQLFNLPYPINVLRNTARLAATTKYVLASDIELYPSINLVPSFIKFINKFDVTKQYGHIKRFDFTLPIFEVNSNVTAPKTKRELVKMHKQKDAIFFHKWVCDECQKFPNRLEWLERDTLLGVSPSSDDGEIKIFEVTQRNKSAEYWEPIFIGTNDDPLYDDRLTWDGRRDKMGHMYEMCLLDYYHFVLGNAFLVHAPGVKHIDKNDTIRRLNFMKENNAIFDETIKRLKKQYSGSVNIDKC